MTKSIKAGTLTLTLNAEGDVVVVVVTGGVGTWGGGDCKAWLVEVVDARTNQQVKPEDKGNVLIMMGVVVPYEQ